MDMHEKEWLQKIGSGKNEVSNLLECNSYMNQFGLRLTNEDVGILLNDRRETLKAEQRIEFGESILKKLIFAFCDSPYIQQDNLVDTLGRLQEIFYEYKNESLDELTDDELVDYMKKEFEGDCQGSLEFLEETVLERLARKIRRTTRGFMGSYQEEDDYEEYDSNLSYEGEDDYE